MSEITARGARFNYQLLGPQEADAQRVSESDPARCVVVYLHGLIMDNLSSGYFTFAQAVSAQRTLLLYDLRGHGKSERTTTGYSVKAHALDLLALLEALNLTERPLALIGSSFGGAVALECARLAPERVQRLCLIDGHPNSSAFFEQLGADLTASPEVQRALIAAHFQHWLGRDVPRKRQKLAKRAEGLLNDTTLLADLRESALSATPPTKLPPTLALYGAESDALPLAQAQLSGVTSVEWRLFEGRSHALLWEETEAVKAALLAWLS